MNKLDYIVKKKKQSPYNRDSAFIYDKLSKNVITYDELINENAYHIKYKCIVCGRPIISNINRIDTDNLVCNKCHKAYNNASTKYDKKIAKAKNRFLRFVDYYMKLIMRKIVN